MVRIGSEAQSDDVIDITSAGRTSNATKRRRKRDPYTTVSFHPATFIQTDEDDSNEITQEIIAAGSNNQDQAITE